MKTDARIRYTRMRIKEAFFALLAQKEFPQITVTELCEMAEISRGTFYKHYADMSDLLQKTEEEILETVRKKPQQLAPKSTVEGMEKILTGLLHSPTTPARSLFRADPRFADRISEILCEEGRTRLMEISGFSPTESEMLHRFLIYGCGSVTRNWLLSEESNRISAHDLAEFLFRLTEKITH